MGKHAIFIKDPRVWVIVRCYPQPWKIVRPMTVMQQAVVSTQTIYCPSIGTIKLSIHFFYHRIFRIPSSTFRCRLLVVGGLVMIYSVAGIPGAILQCVPLSDLWKPPTINPPICIHFDALVITVGVVNALTDFAILSLPIPLIWTLQVSKSRKWQLVLVFSLGGL